jgi:hypothetical protein
MRVERDNRFSQVGFVQVRVYFSGGDGFMSQHLLNGPQIGTALHQVRGEGVSEGMGTDRLLNTRIPGQFLNDGKNHVPCEHLSPAVQEKDIFISGLYGQGIPVKQVKIYLLEGTRTDGY